MTSKINIQATQITQPKAGKQIQNSKEQNIKSPSVCRDGNANPSYHPWEYKTLNNFIKGKQIQCGRKSTYHCNLKTVRWIKGYRNTCPIAGCCGTFNRPAPLILDKFNFKEKQITKAIKINKVKVEYQHKCTGVNVGVGTGSETTSWAGYFPYVTLVLYKNSTKIQSITYDKTVPLAKNGTVSVTFTKAISSFNPTTDNLRIEINYPANGDGKYYDKATNPSIIYASGLKINMEYDYLNTPKILPEFSIEADKETIITDPRNPSNSAGNNNCRSTITHTIRYINIDINNTQDVNKKIIVDLPSNVKKEISLNTAKQTITYIYQDISGVEGRKNIVYYLSSDKKQKITKQFTSKLYSKPSVNIIQKYIKNQQYNNDTFIAIDGNCWNNIKIYADGNQKLLISFNKNNLNQENFLNQINQLICGNHTLYIYIDDVFYKQINIVVSAPIISFDSNLRQKYTLSKDKQIDIDITRTDNNQLQDPINVTIIDTAGVINTFSFSPQETHTQALNIDIAGEYELKCQYNDGCKDTEYIIGKYIVQPEHRQSYDYLLVRGVDDNVEYNSLVVREGDTNQKPITYTHAVLKNSMNDFVLFGKDGLFNIGELGHGILAVKNISRNVIKNLAIELNPLKLSEDEYDDFDARIMEWKTGMLQHFDDNFYILNPRVKDVVEVFNIQNKDLINEGTENVVLRFSEIQPNDVIEVKIPYMSSYPSHVLMNFLVLGEAHDFIELDKTERFSPYTVAYSSYTNADFISQNGSKMAERQSMSICLQTQDAFSTELFIEGDDLDRNDLNNTDDLDITYKIQIPESECDDKQLINNVKTKIINDARLIPTGYRLGNNTQYIFNVDENNNVSYNDDTINVFRGTRLSSYKPMISEDIYLRYLDVNNNIKYIRAITNDDGIAKINFTIPDYFQDTNTDLSENNKKKFYLSDILKQVDILYQGNDFYQNAVLNTENHNLPQTKIQIEGFYYKKQNKEYYVEATKIKNQNITNISELYLIGSLSDINNHGLSEKFVTYENKNNSIYQQVMTGDIPEIEALQSKDTAGYFAVRIRLANNSTTYNLSTIRNNSYIAFDGDLFFADAKRNYGSSSNQIDKIQKTASQLSYIHDYGTYRRGETIEILVQLQKQEEEFENYIEISQTITSCQSKIHIFYKACTEKNEEGWKTIFQTNGGKLLPNKTEEYIYCNVDTDLKILARLEKRIIENNNVNILTINAINGYKPNKDIIIKGIIAPNANKQRLGDYLALTAIDIDKEQYSYDRNSDIIYWNINHMDSYEKQKCNILLQAEHIGHNMIFLGGFDYLHQDEDVNIDTTLTLECDNTSEYRIQEAIPIKAKLQTSDTPPHDVFGNVIFKKYDSNNQEQTFAISEVTNIDGEYYAKAYFRPDENNMRIKAVYEESKIFSVTYEGSESEYISFDNVHKYDTTVRLYSNQEEFKTGENIQIRGSILFNNESEKYFDKNINMKFFIENQELMNINYIDRDYVVNFVVTQAGQYTIQAFIPNTQKTEEASDILIIDVLQGENNE